MSNCHINDILYNSNSWINFRESEYYTDNINIHWLQSGSNYYTGEYFNEEHNIIVLINIDTEYNECAIFILDGDTRIDIESF